MITDTGHYPLAVLSTKQVPRWSLTCFIEGLVQIQLAVDRTER